LKRAQDRVVGARPYAQALAEVIGELYSPELAERFPLLRQPGKNARGGGVRRAGILLITSNRGLCGAFNSNLIREARRRVEELEAQDAHTELHLVGKKGVSYFKFTKRNIASQRVDIGDKPTIDHAVQLATPLMDRFANGDLDAVDIVFAKFNSAVSTPATTLRVLPIEPPAAKGGEGRRGTVNYILKPTAEEILQQLLPLYVQNQVYRALVETAAAEHGARRTAMKNATDAGNDMLTILQRTYNRARQAQITQELAEIVGGAEALKG
jgi:F-type H+-transporting ATPase subunit gamma